ncbi:hypothetical protein QM996_18465 [Sinorhizobium chiapasense]
MFEFHFDLEHAAKIVDGDQRPVAQTAKAFLGNAQFDLGTIAGIPEVVVVEIIVVAVVIPINVMPIVVVAVIVIAIFRPVVTATTVTLTATIVAIIVIGEGCRRERMRRTTCDYRQANGR